MIKPISQRKLDRIRQRITYLYPQANIDRLMERFGQIIGRYGVTAKSRKGDPKWNQKDSILITYGDSIIENGKPSLQSLKAFADKYLKGVFSGIHILPFWPYSSDDGFSVIDYREVSSELGKWSDIRALHENFELMFDIVLNHCSSQSEYFKEFLEGIEPAKNFFITADPEANLTSVVRPRTSALLTKVRTQGKEAHVWTTFSADQVDLNWKNPDVLFEFLDIVLFYISQGARFLRMDAVAFLWKELNSSCIHLPQTHEIIKLFRDLMEIVCPRSVIITETNVPQSENYSYFDRGDEAHMVYQFSLPPLLLHALLVGDSSTLTKWGKEIPEIPEGCTFFNFGASHDGVGMRPTEGLLSDQQRDAMIEAIKTKGGEVSYKTNADGTQSPYELNITYYSALSDGSPEGINRFLCSQSVVMTLRGIPGIYIHSMLGTQNDLEYMKQRNQKRSINRHRWDSAQLEALLSGKHEAHHKEVFEQMSHMLHIRSQNPAFHPDGKQTIYNGGSDLFIVERAAPDGTQRIICVHNFTDRSVKVPVDIMRGLNKDLLTNQKLKKKGEDYILEPYGVAWVG